MKGFMRVIRSFCSALIVSGTNERDMSELRVAQIVAISFGILWAFSLGLNVFG
jgi:hypothetical protein